MASITVIGLFWLCAIQQMAASPPDDVTQSEPGYIPRVALACGLAPFHMDLERGTWVSKSSKMNMCAASKEDALKYCQGAYPKLNITNIVEDNNEIMFNNWCKPGRKKCDIKRKVTPYKCLVSQYEADTLMVPHGCKFDLLHENDMCLTHNEWKTKASNQCKDIHRMTLSDYGILLSCKTDHFTGVEFVCCPNHKTSAEQEKRKKRQQTLQRQALLVAIGNFKRYIPTQVKGCNESIYTNKYMQLKQSHQNELDTVVRNWESMERKYIELKPKHPETAERGLRKILEVFRQTIIALQKELTEEKLHLSTDRAACVNRELARQRRNAMTEYLSAVEEEPVNEAMVLNTVRKFIEVCEKDRLHSLHSLEDARKRNPTAEGIEILKFVKHLEELNQAVNSSISLLNFLPLASPQHTGNARYSSAILERSNTDLDRSSEDEYNFNHGKRHHTPVKPETHSSSKPRRKHGERKAVHTTTESPVTEVPTVTSSHMVSGTTMRKPTITALKVGHSTRQTRLHEDRINVDEEAKVFPRTDVSGFPHEIVMGVTCGIVIGLTLIIAGMMVKRYGSKKKGSAATNDDEECFI